MSVARSFFKTVCFAAGGFGLLVLLLIGGAILWPLLTGYTPGAETLRATEQILATHRADLDQLIGALETYKTQHQRYPATLETFTVPTIAETSAQRHVSELFYQADTTGQTYQLGFSTLNHPGNITYGDPSLFDYGYGIYSPNQNEWVISHTSPPVLSSPK